MEQKQPLLRDKPPMVTTHLAVKRESKWVKMTISTSVWSAQHPNTGRNIQQQGYSQSK